MLSHANSITSLRMLLASTRKQLILIVHPHEKVEMKTRDMDLEIVERDMNSRVRSMFVVAETLVAI